MKSLSWNKNPNRSCLVLSACEPCEQSKAGFIPAAQGGPQGCPWHPCTLMTKGTNGLPRCSRGLIPRSLSGDANPFFGWRAGGLARLVSELQGNLEVKPRFGGGGREVTREPRDGGDVLVTPCPLPSPALGLGEILQLSGQPYVKIWFAMAQPPWPLISKDILGLLWPLCLSAGQLVPAGDCP